MALNLSVKTISWVFFLAAVLLFQTVTFSPLALAQSPDEDTNIPSWFKNNVKWWKEGKLSDEEIVNALENLLNRKIIKLDSTQIKIGTTIPEPRFFLPPNKDGAKIPSYAKDTFVSWEEGMFSDSDVANTIKFLIKENIIITSTSSPEKQPRQLAAIIDQLHDSIPNKPAQQKALKYLENAGYDVDLYTTKDITVDFYKKLPSMNYKFIYIRTHSVEVVELQNSTLLFTGEKYDVNKYIMEQLSGQIHRGVPIYEQLLADEMIKNDQSLPDKTYFMIGSKFMDELATGEFPQSVIIIGGCESLRTKDMAISLMSRGASEVIGWDRTILTTENDHVMLALLEEVLINKIGFYDAVPLVMQKFGSNLHYSSQLHDILSGR